MNAAGGFCGRGASCCLGFVSAAARVGGCYMKFVTSGLKGFGRGS